MAVFHEDDKCDEVELLGQMLYCTQLSFMYSDHNSSLLAKAATASFQDFSSFQSCLQATIFWSSGVCLCLHMFASASA